MKNIILLLLSVSLGCKAQNTISYKEGSASPKAQLSQIAWMEGHWKGEAFGGITEEIWSPPLGDSMMFSFKLVSEGKVQFYELGHIQQVGETLLLQLKHFHGNLKGWEEKDETVDFKLVRLEGNRAYFDDFTFEQINADEINIYVVIAQEDGSREEVKFHYGRQ
ncbi:DUF6265 family protein [Maribacter algicola]|uniref:DUF6265 family protein n=1 Tax=Meishania litoralis TaxID=3434685 RepID=A0ACC7LGJ5_9FLAO